MWVDERGMIHTVDHPGWSDLVNMSPPSYAALRQTPAAWLHDVLDDIEDDVFEGVTGLNAGRAEEAQFVDRLPPRITLGLVGPPAAMPAILADQLVRQPLRWRLDYVWALRECLTSLREWKSDTNRSAATAS